MLVPFKQTAPIVCFIGVNLWGRDLQIFGWESWGVAGESWNIITGCFVFCTGGMLESGDFSREISQHCRCKWYFFWE